MRPYSGISSLILLLTGPVFSASPGSLFMPAHEDNLWIMQHSRYPDSPDTSVHWVESEIIEGEQYWKWKADPAHYRLLSCCWGNFRLDDKGNIWAWDPGQEVRSSAVTALDKYPVFRDSLRTFALGSLDTVSHDRLLFDFDAPDRFRDYDSCDIVQASISSTSAASFSPESLAGAFYFFYYGVLWDLYSWSICEWPVDSGMPSDVQVRLFISVWAGQPATEIMFQRGLGPIWIGYERSRVHLIWARIEGKEHGTHPGPGFPGNLATSTLVSSWGKVKENQRTEVSP